jgi:hypothetical protein
VLLVAPPKVPKVLKKWSCLLSSSISGLSWTKHRLFGHTAWNSSRHL